MTHTLKHKSYHASGSCEADFETLMSVVQRKINGTATSFMHGLSQLYTCIKARYLVMKKYDDRSKTKTTSNAVHKNIITNLTELLCNLIELSKKNPAGLTKIKLSYNSPDFGIHIVVRGKISSFKPISYTHLNIKKTSLYSIKNKIYLYIGSHTFNDFYSYVSKSDNNDDSMTGRKTGRLIHLSNNSMTGRKSRKRSYRNNNNDSMTGRKKGRLIHLSNNSMTGRKSRKRSHHNNNNDSMTGRKRSHRMSE